MKAPSIPPGVHVETVHRATVVYAVPLDAEQRVVDRAHGLRRAGSSPVNVTTYGASCASFPWAEFEGPSRRAVELAAGVFARYVLRFKGARLDP